MKWITWQTVSWYKRFMRYIVYTCIASLAIFFVYYYGISDRVVTTLSVVVDPCLDYHTHATLKSRIQDTFFTCGYELLPHTIAQQFPCVDTVSYIRKLRTHSFIKCTAHVPLALIDNEKILTRKGLLIARHYYRADRITHLPIISVGEPLSDTDLHTMASWCVHIPENIKKHVTFLWKNPTEIHLYFKKYPKNPVFITIQTHLTEEYMRILQSIIASDDLTSIDARFKGMIIGTLPGNKHRYKNKRRRV